MSSSRHTFANVVTFRGVAAAASIALAAVVLAACTPPTPTEPSVPTSTQNESSAELQRFYDQKLSFGACEGYATTAADEAAFVSNPSFQCARLEVPLDYSDPAGRTMQIALLKAPARGEPIGSLLLNPGGPGGPGVGMAASTSVTLQDSPVTEKFDLIGFDPRGVGASTPAIDCLTDAEVDTTGPDVFPGATIEGEWTEQDSRISMERCAEKSGGVEVLAHVGTRDAVRDMDVLRHVLGDEKLNFLGQSYGTRLGAVYAEMFPENVRAMVLDGAIDPKLGTAERRISQFTSFQRSFDAMAAECATRPDCPFGTDPALASANFQGIIRPLLDNPIPVGEGRQLTYNLAFGGVVAGLYDSTAWPVIAKGVAEVAAGRGDTLLAINDLFGQRTPDGRWPNFGEAIYAINCNDEERHTPDEEQDLKRRLHEAAPFMDSGQGPGGARDGCEFWPAEPSLGYPYATDIDDLPETLTISITGDPTTPYEGGISLADTLGGTMLTVEGETHTIAATGTNDCVDDIVADYLIDLKAPPADSRCTL